jgi:hypothetical protein
MIEAPVLSPVYISEFESVSEIHRHNRIHRLLFGVTRLPCFGCVVMLPATAYLWYHNQMQKNNFIVLLTT